MENRHKEPHYVEKSHAARPMNKGRCKMKRVIMAFMTIPFMLLLCLGIRAEAAKASQGEQAFMKNCAVCHASGGNIITPAKTLHKKDLAANGIRKPDDIVGKMRNPGPEMERFDEKAIPDKEARAIADYVLKTFK
jgi:cytochrome c6